MSLAAALCQALAVRDEAALESCLQAQETSSIAGSVAGLSPTQAGVLLEALVGRLHCQPQQAARVVSWLRSLLLAHGAALAAAPAGQAALKLAQDVLQERTETHSALLALAGRLQVLRAAATDNSGPGKRTTAGPHVIFTH